LVTQLDLLKLASEVLAEMGVSFMVVGSLASSSYGEARHTNDIDIAVWLEREDVAVLRRAFPDSEFYFDEQTALESIREGGIFNVIHIASVNKIDFMVSSRDLWSREQFWRRREVNVFGFTTFAAAPEDVIISKLRYFDEGKSDKHLRDIVNMMCVEGAGIDEACVVRWAQHFKVIPAWNMVLQRLGRQPI